MDAIGASKHRASLPGVFGGDSGVERSVALTECRLQPQSCEPDRARQPELPHEQFLSAIGKNVQLYQRLGY